MLRIAMLLIGGLLVAGAAARVRADGPPLPLGPLVGDQELAPFYRWSEALPSRAGVMLRAEPMPAQAEIAHAGVAQRILYTSTDLRWRAGIVPVSGSLYLPKGEPPAGGWPLVAWAHGTLGVADSCAPSWTGHKPRDATYIDRWLGQGFAVVATDYQGLGGPGPHPYLIWEAEGRSVLDSARAALAAHQGKLGRQVFVTGQSQGSGAALGATRIAPSYAPDVPLLATVATGVVSTFPAGPYQAPTRIESPRYLLFLMLGGGLSDDSSAPDSLVSEKGKRVLEAARTSCGPEVNAAAKREGVTLENAFAEPLPKLTARLTRVTDMSPVAMPVPVLLGTGLADSTLAPKRQYAAAVALCAAGSRLQWKTYPGATHNGGLNAAFPDALALFRAVMVGEAPPSSCGSLAEPGEPGAPAAGIAFND